MKKREAGEGSMTNIRGQIINMFSSVMRDVIRYYIVERDVGEFEFECL